MGDGSLDPRRLGVPIEQIALSGAGMRIEIDPDCSGLRDGFHRDEGSHRWTDGFAKLPAGLIAHFADDVTIDLRIGETDLHYPIGKPTDRPRREPEGLRLDIAG
jgi:hypothetical protein